MAANSTKSKNEVKNLTIVGGGLVGGLTTVLFGQLGYTVNLYERRPDIRTMEVVKGRSINMALSTRGRESLKLVNLEEEVLANGIPMYARMIHDSNGTTRPVPYGQKEQCIISIDRRRLNEILLDAAEKFSNVKLNFDHKLASGSLVNNSGTFLKSNDESVTVNYDVIFGCDGAYSNVRAQVNKALRFNFKQEYIPHGYMELCIPATPDKKFAMAVNYLHIWPRNEFMLIALPNPDASFTVTLFMPFAIFETLKTKEDLLRFFNQNFKDALPLIGEEALISVFFSSKALPLMTVKCFPYHFEDVAVLLGDAAHAMVPFYGQGMNAGFEDCLVLYEILKENNFDFHKSLQQYSNTRHQDAVAICDLAMDNYVEMRASVNSISFLVRKKIDLFLNYLFPNWWIPLYTSVAFTRIPYLECIENRKWQDRLIEKLIFSSLSISSLSLTYFLYRKYAKF